MKGERRQEQIRSEEERPVRYGDRAAGVELSQAASVALAASEFIAGAEQGKRGEAKRTYFRRAGQRPSFLVLRDSGGANLRPKEEDGVYPAGPSLIRSETWLLEPETARVYSAWLDCADEALAVRALQRIYFRLRAAAAALLETAEGAWAAVTLLQPPELAAAPQRLAALQDVQLGALFAAVADHQRLGGDSRIDLLAVSPASAGEFALTREFVESVAEQTLGHAYAAACCIGALLAPDVPHAAAAEIARTADFLVLDGAADDAAPEAAAEDFAEAAGGLLAAVRCVKPAAAVFAAGAPAATALADLYRIGLSGIFCADGQRTEALLRAACLTWMARQESMDTTAEGWL